MLNKRTQILFEEGLWKRLVKIAKIENTSIGSLIRKAVEEKYLKEMELVSTKALLEEIERIRPNFKGKIDYRELLSYGRR